MTEILNIPQIVGEDLSIEIEPSRTLYIVGANGSGKSSLLYSWTSVMARTGKKLELIAGNREVVFSNSSVTQSPSQRNQFETHKQNELAQTRTRTHKTNANSSDRLAGLLGGIEGAINHQARVHHKACQENDEIKINETKGDTVVDKINQILETANLPLSIEIDDRTVFQVKKNSVGPYEILQMSDGERAALILAMEVLLADQSKIILIDEPERHLHRSISEPLIAKLREIRPDLYFVISTHDLSLPRGDRGGQILALYNFEATQKKWKAQIHQDISSMEPEIFEAILGGREKILFVEGDEASLDKAIYNILYHNHTIVPAGNCTSVKKAVAGMRVHEDLHHLEAKGIVDGDNIANDDATGLLKLQLYGVEALYYLPEVITAVIADLELDKSLESVLEGAFTFLNSNFKAKIIKDASYKAFKQAYGMACPSEANFCNMEIALPNGEAIKVAKEAEINAVIDSKDWGGVLKLVNIKNEGVRNKIALALELSDFTAYEKRALKVIGISAELKATLASYVQ